MNAVLVYQMGKVGSSTISATLDSWGVENYHFHYLQENQLEAIERSRLSKGLKVSGHIETSRYLLESGVLERRPLKIVSLVRDPVARNVSAFFENIDNFFPTDNLDTIHVESLIDTFLKKYPHDIATKWFDNEFYPSLGVNVFDCQLDTDKGYFNLCKDDIQILIIKVETEDAIKAKALGEFCGLPDKQSLVEKNIGEKKLYSDAYKRFKEAIILPDKYLDAAYNSELMIRLYSEDEREKMYRKWTARGNIESATQ